jgi:hypothetical protein
MLNLVISHAMERANVINKLKIAPHAFLLLNHHYGCLANVKVITSFVIAFPEECRPALGSNKFCGQFPLGRSGRGVKLAVHLHIVLRLRVDDNNISSQPVSVASYC